MAENPRACASCGSPNEEDARFCEGCGAALARVCGTCGVQASATARFCRGCGAPLGGQAAAGPAVATAGPVRKTVSVMFADLAGSTTFEENVDAETAREVIGRYHELLRATAEQHRAGVTKYIGDGFMAVWGVPEIGADDAARAVDAAAELQERFIDLAAQVAQTHGTDLALRVAVNTGEVVVGAGDADLVGDALNVAARLEAECPRGQVVVGEETWRATRSSCRYESLGQVQVKGRTAPVAVYQWRGRQSESPDALPFVGRSDEVRRLQAVLRDAIASRAARLVTVIGDPGVGKSRLAAEFVATQVDTCVIEARCALEKTVALGPIIEVLRARDLENDVPAGTAERDRLLRDLDGLTEGVAGSVEENFWALRRFIELLATGGPVLLVLDDIQWAGTLLLDFVEHLVEWVQDAPVVVLALARPELREIRPDLVTLSRWVSEAVPLTGLDARATAELAANVLGAAQLPDELLRRLPTSTGGNPLFVRELIGMLAHDGVLVEQPTGWRLTIDVDAIAIPPTIHALLASRLERLVGADRRVLEIASVIGSDFSVGAVQALTGAGADAVEKSLNHLRRLDLAQPSGAYVGDEPVWRFHHVLIRDVAYRRLLKSDRADLHERLADWVASGGASMAFDSDELIARHLEAAYTYRLELGQVDHRTADLALRAARRYAVSSRRALDRDELVSAGTQAALGATLANADPAVHAELLLTGCEAFLSAGDVAAGAPLVDELERISDDVIEPWATCYRCQFIVYTAPERLLEVDARLQGAVNEFSRRADSAGLAKAHRVSASARFRLGRVGDAEVDLFEALIAARQSGDHRQITAALTAAPGAALWGPSPVPKAGGRCLDVVRMQRMTTAAPSLEATSMRHLAVLELLRGRPDKARTMLADARQLVADLGLRHGLMETELFAGIIESMEGDPVAAEPHFRTALEGLDALGVGADAGLAAALLSRSVLAQGRIAEADRHATESERLAGRNLKTAIAWRAVRAEILAANGQHTEAAAMAREAASVAAGTDLVLDHAEACLALARVLAAAGDAKGSKSARDEADRLYAAKEVALAIGRTPEPAVAVAEIPADVPAPRAGPSRLAVTNQSCDFLPAFVSALRDKDVEAVVTAFAEELEYDDRRRLSGDPVIGRDAMREATVRMFRHYSHFEFRMLAVRGERLHLLWSRWSDDSGNQTTALYVNESDDDGLIRYHGRFDEDDFEGAYREFERRYYAGEGAAFAESGAMGTEWQIAMNAGDYDQVFNELTTADLHVEDRSRSGFPIRSAQELRSSFEDLDAMVGASRIWASVVHWLTPNVVVARFERAAIGQDGEEFSWSRLFVTEVREERLASMCFFEIADEAAAFAYAKERTRADASRLAVTNRSCDYLAPFTRAARAHDVEGALACYSDRFVYDDRRRISGDPVVGRDAMRVAIERVFAQYNDFQFRILAVRGEHLHLVWSRWTDDDGNENATLYVNETDDDGLVHYHGRFDEDDFVGAYRELERRYYAGEGAPFAEAGALGTEWVIALNQGDFDMVFSKLTAPEMRVENRSLSLFGDRSAEELRATFEDLHDTITSARIWVAAEHWASPHLVIARFEREALGRDGEIYAWTRIHVAEIRDGQVAHSCRFELEDEDAAFAYAEERARATASRLPVTNRASETVDRGWRAMHADDVDGAVAGYSDQFVYDDRRRLSGNPINGAAEMHAAITRLREQYPHGSWRTLTVRGQRLELRWSRWWDDAGSETTALHVHEIGDDGRIVYHCRFDEDDYEGAYRELERRYYAGEGADFAANGPSACEALLTLNRGEFETFVREFCSPDFHVENRSRSAMPDRSGDDLLASFIDLDSMVATSRTWMSAVSWLSPECSVSRLNREAVGPEREEYAWTLLIVAEHRNGLFTSMCEFDPEDEDAAFAYAQERAREHASRLTVKNRATETIDIGRRALRARDADAVSALYADGFVFDDRRRLSGDPIVGKDGMQTAAARLVEQYPHAEWRTLAVRGELLLLEWSRWSDDAGNEASYLHVREVDADGLITYDGRFDGDDFESAYRELDRRYYSGEGIDFAEPGVLATEYALALNAGDYDRAFGELTAPGFRLENHSRAMFPTLSAAEFRASYEELTAMVASSRAWISAVVWLSPNWLVTRVQREAVGRDGETYEWLRIHVSEVRDGRLASMCLFEIDDEEAAFTFAEERWRVGTGRLAVTNRAVQGLHAFVAAMGAHDLESAVKRVSEQWIFEDRRRLGGNPLVGGPRSALIRILQQYSNFDARILAVRGQRLVLLRSQWSDDSGNETSYLHVEEFDDDGVMVSDIRFDEHDFESAYRELDRRYFGGEGAVFAEAGAIATEWVLALTNNDLDRAFGELSTPDLHVENRSRAAFPHRSATELRATFEELANHVVSSRTWLSAMRWSSPTCAVVRLEREATGQDGERFEWTRLHVCGFEGGRLSSVCQFDLEDEESAFVYAEEISQKPESRLAVENHSTRTTHEFWRALRARDVDAALACCSEEIVYDDRRRLAGNPIDDLAGIRAAFERILDQYTKFESRMLAVRGEYIHLGWSRWLSDEGYETAYLHVSEVGDDGKIIFEGRFDGDDFVGAYRELNRRYYAGPGADFAEGGSATTAYAVAENLGDLDRVFGELTTPDFRVENRSRSVFGDRTAAEFRAAREELNAMVESVRSWHSAIYWLSPTVGVGRFEREALGRDGERYAWSLITVVQVRDGRLASTCMFELEDEAAAFEYAEEKARSTTGSLAVANLASRTSDEAVRLMQARDTDGVVACYAEAFVYDDRRRLSGRPLDDLRTANLRILAQYSQFEARTLAVRGERLHLGWSRWRNDSGFETCQLAVREVNPDGRFIYEGRFDEDDFIGAYRALEERYYSGEGAAFADAGAVDTEWLVTLNEGDLDRLFGELTAPDFRFEVRSRSAFPDRSAQELRASIEQLNSMVASTRSWHSAVHWVSPTCCVSRNEREAVGPDGEQFSWTRIFVYEAHDGRGRSLCEFDLDDENAAFAYAEELARAAHSRLTVYNLAAKTWKALHRSALDRDFDRLAQWYSPSWQYDDRRRMSGQPIDDMRSAIQQIAEQYSQFEERSLAVRGDRLHLGWTRWVNESGFESSGLWVHEVDQDGLFIYVARFDEDDFEAAYGELEDRYHAGEGAEFAETGSLVHDFTTAMDRGEFDRILGELTVPAFRIENRSRLVFPDRSASELTADLEELNTWVASTRNWNSAVCWLSPSVFVGSFEREATGADGELYAWSGIDVTAVHGRKLASVCLFDADDEEAAFAYADELMHASSSRLAVTNRAKQTWDAVDQAVQNHDLDAVAACYAEQFEFTDRRGLGAHPPDDDVRAATTRIMQQYSRFEPRTLAVRGERIHLGLSRWPNDAGYAATYLFVHEVDEDGRFIYEARYEERDFEAAYRELEERYYSGEGAAFAPAGVAQTEWLTALNRGDLDRLFGELSAPDLRFEMRSSSAFPESSAVEARAAIEDFNATVAAARTWLSAVHWVSPTCCVNRTDREAFGRDGEHYEWTRLSVVEFREGRMASEREFDLEDEAAAFVYAEQRVRAARSRLIVENCATRRWERVGESMSSRDVDAVLVNFAADYANDDRRRLSGDPVVGLAGVRTAVRRILEQFTHFEERTLAVRGENLLLSRTRWWNDAGFETTHLHLIEISDDGLITYEGRFDEDDFVGAYRELTRRYCAAEGAAVAEGAAFCTEWLIALNTRDLDRLIGELTDPAMSVENRSRSAFPHRSAAELRTTLEQLDTLVAQTRIWNSAEYWLDPTCLVTRNEREARGPDGELYVWTRLFVFETRDGRCTYICEFEVDDEAAAFAYAEERMRNAKGS